MAQRSQKKISTAYHDKEGNHIFCDLCGGEKEKQRDDRLLVEMMMEIFPDKTPRQLKMPFDGKPGKLHPVGDLFITHFLLAGQEIGLPLLGGKTGDDLPQQLSAFPFLHVDQYIIVMQCRNFPPKVCQPGGLDRDFPEMVEYGVPGQDKEIVLQALYVPEQPPLVPYLYEYDLHDLPGGMLVFYIGHDRIVDTSIGRMIEPAKSLFVSEDNQRQ